MPPHVRGVPAGDGNECAGDPALFRGNLCPDHGTVHHDIRPGRGSLTRCSCGIAGADPLVKSGRAGADGAGDPSLVGLCRGAACPRIRLGRGAVSPCRGRPVGPGLGRVSRRRRADGAAVGTGGGARVMPWRTLCRLLHQGHRRAAERIRLPSHSQAGACRPCRSRGQPGAGDVPGTADGAGGHPRRLAVGPAGFRGAARVRVGNVAHAQRRQSVHHRMLERRDGPDGSTFARVLETAGICGAGRRAEHGRDGGHFGGTRQGAIHQRPAGLCAAGGVGCHAFQQAFPYPHRDCPPHSCTRWCSARSTTLRCWRYPSSSL